MTYVKARAWEIALRGALDARVTAGHPASEFKWDNDQTTLLAMLRADDAAWVRAGLGDKMRLVCGYAPSTVNLHDVIFAVEGDQVVDVWPVFPRGPGHCGFRWSFDTG